MPDVFLIMGNHRGARKSATIRALTGAYRHKVYRVAVVNGNDIQIFVHSTSIQEKHLSPDAFIQMVTPNNYSNILVSLWISQENEQPNGLAYIQAFLDHGWSIRQISVLGSDRLPYTLPNGAPAPNYVNDTRNMAVNSIASQIRSWWGWL